MKGGERDTTRSHGSWSRQSPAPGRVSLEPPHGVRSARSTAYGALGLAAVLVLGGASCTPAKPKLDAKPSASAKPAASGSGVTRELAQLIKAARAKLSPAAAHARLKKALETFPKQHSKEREELLIKAVAEGALDPIEWTTITSNYKGRRTQIQVTSDALKILGVRFDVTADGAQRIADQLQASLPTPRILQLVWEQAAVRLEPCTLPADAKMASTARMVQHSECVDQRIAGRMGLVANEGKHWVLTNRIAGKRNLAANYGWFVKGRRPVQTVGTRHDTAHTDYSQIVRLVKPVVIVDGRPIDIRKVGRSEELWGLVSDEGPLFVWRASGTESAPAAGTNLVTAAAPVLPGDPKAVRVNLKLEGMPITPEQLPATTTALRRNTLLRRVLVSLRLRTADVPEEAYWSAAAAACGGRDIFFDLLNGVPVDAKELERDRALDQKALACGKALTPQLRAGIQLYEVQYSHEALPTGLGLLALSDTSFRDKILHPPLAPTPAGVHRAYCNDDDGQARSVCEDGARSRLLLAVNNGFIAAYAREVPELLARFAESVPPSPKVAELVATFLEKSAADEVAVAEGGQCAFSVDFAFVELSPDETSRQRVLDAINDNAEWCATRSGGTLLGASRELAFSAKTETAAQVILAALKRRALEVRYEAAVATSGSKAQQDFTKAMRSAAARAARSAKVELEGKRVSLSLTLAPSAEEMRGMQPLLDTRRDMAKRAAEVIRNVAAGKPPSAELLASFAKGSVERDHDRE